MAVYGLPELLSIITAVTIIIAAIYAGMQFKEIKKANKATAFRNYYEYMQREHVRKARGVLINLGKNIHKKIFNNWSDEEIKKAEIVCYTYNLAGIMVVERLIDEDLVVKRGHDSIVKCWEAAKPMLEEYRVKQKRGNDFWEDFDTLYDKAKEIEKKVKRSKKNRANH